MTLPVQELDAGYLPQLRRHFAALPRDDLRLRFGTALAPVQVDSYVARLNFERDSLFGVFSDDLELVGVAHLWCSDRAAELGLSVLPGHRRRGLGTALFQRAVLRARNRQIIELFMHCLADNAIIAHIAKKAGMRIVTEHGESDAFLELPHGTAATLGQELAEQQLALFDWTAKNHVAQVRQAARVYREQLGAQQAEPRVEPSASKAHAPIGGR